MDNNSAHKSNPTESTEHTDDHHHHDHIATPKYMSQRTLILVLALGGITLFFLFLALRPQFESKAPQMVEVSPTATPTPYAQSVLSLVPSQSTPAATPGTLKYDLVVNSNINTVNAVQVDLGFDPKVLSNITITQGTFFPKPVVLIKDVNYKTGRISYAIGIQPTDYGVKGQGTVATISFQYLKSAGASTKLEFMPKTLVAAEGVTQSVLKEATSITIPLSSPQGTMNQSQSGY
jgi:hypothetical protein